MNYRSGGVLIFAEPEEVQNNKKSVARSRGAGLAQWSLSLGKV